MNWGSRDLIAERLRQAAGDDPIKRLAAGYILVSRDWCWDKLLANAPEVATADGQLLKVWALDTMRQWALPGSKLPHVLQSTKGD